MTLARELTRPGSESTIDGTTPCEVGERASTRSTPTKCGNATVEKDASFKQPSSIT
jgi:hypothetical protein